MSKLELVNFHLKNTKLNNMQLRKICHCFAYDYTASKTAQELGLSRQTINNYYKIIRETLIEEQDKIDNLTFSNDFLKNPFILKYLSIHSQIIYYIELNEKVYILNEEEKNLEKILDFVKSDIKDSLINHKRANSARILYNSYQDEYFVTTHVKSSNDLEKFIDQRLKKFRGLNKNNIMIHIKESIIRFHNKETLLYNSLSKIFIH